MLCIISSATWKQHYCSWPPFSAQRADMIKLLTAHIVRIYVHIHIFELKSHRRQTFLT